MKKTLILYLLVSLVRISAFGQDITIIANEGYYLKDDNLKMIVCNRNIRNYDNLSGVNTISIVLSGTSYDFTTIPENLEIGKEYLVVNQSNEYKLFFTVLPLINIYSDFAISNEPKVLANFMISDTTDIPPISSFCGIELRGGASQSYPKKSYDFELWIDEFGTSERDISLLNMREDGDWILLALYNEPLRLSNVTNHDLWRKIHTPYYIENEENAMSGIRTKFVEIALNNEYLGIYALGEQIDKKQLQLKSFNSTIRGELYKGIGWGASTFSYLTEFNNNSRTWSGFEMKYPDTEDTTQWLYLYNFVDFVLNSTDNDFNNDFSNKFNRENAIDYFIFLNLLRATDNTGKNIYIAKYKSGEPYFYVPWDLDGTYGTIWNGTQENITNNILSNGMFNRLLAADNSVFKLPLSSRWFELRNGVLKTDSIKNNIIRNFNLLSENGNYVREIYKWGNSSIDFANIDYTMTWIDERLLFLDTYFDDVTSINQVENCNDIVIFPNPTSDFLNFNFTKNNIEKLKIYDITGKLIIEKTKIQQNEQFDLSNFESGIYIILIQTDKGLFTTKIIKIECF